MHQHFKEAADCAQKKGAKKLAPFIPNAVQLSSKYRGVIPAKAGIQSIHSLDVESMKPAKSGPSRCPSSSTNNFTQAMKKHADSDPW